MTLILLGYFFFKKLLSFGFDSSSCQSAQLPIEPALTVPTENLMIHPHNYKLILYNSLKHISQYVWVVLNHEQAKKGIPLSGTVTSYVMTDHECAIFLLYTVLIDVSCHMLVACQCFPLPNYHFG